MFIWELDELAATEDTWPTINDAFADYYDEEEATDPTNALTFDEEDYEDDDEEDDEE